MEVISPGVRFDGKRNKEFAPNLNLQYLGFSSRRQDLLKKEEKKSISYSHLKIDIRNILQLRAKLEF